MITLATVTDLQVKGELNFLKGTYNIIDCGIRTGKTYWAINHLKQFSRDERLDRILFLVDTTALKIQFLLNMGIAAAMRIIGGKRIPLGRTH